MGHIWRVRPHTDVKDQMTIVVVTLISQRIVEAEANVGVLDGRQLSGALESAILEVDALTDDERRGCVAEIVGHRFMTWRQRGPLP